MSSTSKNIYEDTTVGILADKMIDFAGKWSRFKHTYQKVNKRKVKLRRLYNQW